MASGDGLLVRVRAGARSLRSDEVRGLASVARACGNGVLEITRRANLQLRGLSAQSLPEAQRDLVRMGLVEASAARELRLSLQVDPWCAFDTDAETVPQLVAALEPALRAAEDIWALPAKFGIAVGSMRSAFEHSSAEIRLRQNRAWCELEVAGQEGWVAFARSEAIAGSVCAVIQLMRELHAWNFAALRGEAEAGVPPRAAEPCSAPRAGRMRDWLRSVGAQRAGERFENALARTCPAARLLPARAPTEIAAQAMRGAGTSGSSPGSGQRRGRLGFAAAGGTRFEVAYPFGTGDAAQWEQLAACAQRFGTGQLRITPERSVILPGVREVDAPSLAAQLRGAGLIVDDGDPLRRVVACAGAPRCSSALGDTREFARRSAAQLAPLLAAGARLHVSGCEKACALAGPAEITLVRSQRGARLGLGASAAETALHEEQSEEQLAGRLRELTRAAVLADGGG